MKKLSLLTITLLITACANKEPRSYTILEDNIQVNNEQSVHLHLERPYRDDKEISDKFRVVKPSHTAQLTGLKVLGFLTGQRTTGFSKDELVGDVIPAENIYTNYTFPKLKSLIQQNVKLNKETKRRIITVHPMEFKIVYDELIGNNNYTLYYSFLAKTQYQEKKENGEITAGDHIFKCEETVGNKDFAEWEKDNYALAISSAKQLTDKCLNNMADFLSKVK